MKWASKDPVTRPPKPQPGLPLRRVVPLAFVAFVVLGASPSLKAGMLSSSSGAAKSLQRTSLGEHLCAVREGGVGRY